MRPNKLEGLSLENLSSQVLEFEGKVSYYILYCINAGAVPTEHIFSATYEWA